MTTKVVNLNDEPYEIYIGRMDSDMKLEGSIWGNPFIIGRDGDRDEVIAKYKGWLLGIPELLERLPELEGKVLGCWCKPKACHGDFLVELVKGLAADLG